MATLQEVADFYRKELTADAIETMLKETEDNSRVTVGSMFSWSDTPQGHKYWLGIDRKFYDTFGNSFGNLRFKELLPLLSTPPELLAMEKLKPWRR